MQSGKSHHSQNVLLVAKSFSSGTCLMPGSAEHWWDCAHLPESSHGWRDKLQPAQRAQIFILITRKCFFSLLKIKMPNFGKFTKKTWIFSSSQGTSSAFLMGFAEGSS